MWILPPRSCTQVDTQGGSPKGSTNAPDKPRITRSLLQRKCDGTDVWMLLWLSLWVWEPSLWSRPQGTLPLKTDLQASASKQCVTRSTQNAGKAIFLHGRKGIHRKCVFMPLSCRNSLASKTWRHPGLLQGPKLQSGPCVSLHLMRLTNTFLCQSYCPWGSRLQECVWEWWVPYCGQLIEVTLHSK